jgi:hypothetical protein
MTFSLSQVGRHLLATRVLLGRRQVQIAITVATIATILSIVLAPDTSATTWDWIRFGLIGFLGSVAVLTFASSHSGKAEPDDRQQRLVIAAVFVALAIVLNLTFTIGTTLIFSVGITAVALLAGEDRDYRSSWMVVGALIAAIPFWVWSALQAWTGGLLLLIPLAAIGIIADGHMRAAVGEAIDAGSPLTSQAHRLGSWAGILGLATDASSGVVALGAIGAIVFVALEAGSPLSAKSSPRTSIALTDVALLWVALCWIVSL